MGVRLKREELTDYRTRIPCQVTDTNYEKPMGHSERAPDVLTRCKEKQGAPTINQSLNCFSVLQTYHYHKNIHFIFVKKLITQT
jgi:hypothetical protein